MERVNLDYKLSPAKIPSLIAQENITIISKNGNILAGELIDFTANIEMVKQNIYEFEAIVKSLKIFEKQHIINSKNNTNYYALFNKPEPKSVQEKFLNHLKSLDQTDFINFQLEEASYIETLEQKILKEEYQKFSVFEESLGL
jgi:intein/homing endonuclease